MQFNLEFKIIVNPFEVRMSATSGGSSSSMESPGQQLDAGASANGSLQQSAVTVGRAPKRSRMSDDGEEENSGDTTKSTSASGQTAQSFQTVQSKNTRKVLQKEERKLDRLRRDISSGTTGVFKVVFKKKVVPSEQPVSLDSKLQMDMLKDLYDKFPGCNLSSGKDCVLLWANKLEVAQSAMKLTSLAECDIVVSCAALGSFRAAISGVSVTFSEEDIVEELKDQGVTSARKFGSSRDSSGSLRLVGKVLLTFSSPPPEQVFLVYRHHIVTLEAARPLICFRCQRLGHIAAQCKKEKACRNCGASDHLAKICKNQTKCINCGGLHASGSNKCPRVILAHEKNRLYMEARVLQQVQASTPAAKVAIQDAPTLISGDSIGTTGTGVSSLQTRSYAATVRGIVVEQVGKEQTRIILPKQRIFKKIQRRGARTRRTQKPPGRRLNTGKNDLRKNLEDVAEVVHHINPQAAQALKSLAAVLAPLLKLAPLLNGLRNTSLFSSSK